MGTLTTVEAFDKFFSSGLDTYPLMYSTAPQTVFPLARPDLGMTYDCGIIIGYHASVGGLTIDWPYTIAQVTGGVTAGQIEVWAMVRAFRNTFAAQSGDLCPTFELSVSFNAGTFGTYLATCSRKLHPARGWQVVRVRYILTDYTMSRMSVKLAKADNVACPFLLVDSWGYNVIV